MAQDASDHANGSANPDDAGADPRAEELRQQILLPLHLENTSLATTTTIPGLHAHGYIIGTDGPTDVTTTAEDLRGLLGSGSGAVVSTLDDLARFYTDLLGGRLLPAELLDQMLTPIPTPVHWADIPSSGYGFGQTRVELPCGSAWGHGGGMDGYLTEVITDRTGRHVTIVAVNAEWTFRKSLQRLFYIQVRCGLVVCDRSSAFLASLRNQRNMGGTAWAC